MVYVLKYVSFAQYIGIFVSIWRLVIAIHIQIHIQEHTYTRAHYSANVLLFINIQSIWFVFNPVLSIQLLFPICMYLCLWGRSKTVMRENLHKNGCCFNLLPSYINSEKKKNVINSDTFSSYIHKIYIVAIEQSEMVCCARQYFQFIHIGKLFI